MYVYGCVWGARVWGVRVWGVRVGVYTTAYMVVNGKLLELLVSFHLYVGPGVSSGYQAA